MRKVVLLLMSVLSLSVVSGQESTAPEYSIEDGAIRMTRIFEATGLSVQDAHDRVFLHMARIMNNSNHTCRVDLPSELFYRGLYADVALLNMGLGAILDYDVPFDLHISIKENRLRVVIEVIYTQRDLAKLYNFVDAWPINNEHNYMDISLNKKQAQEVFDLTLERMDSMIDDIGQCVYTPADNW